MCHILPVDLVHAWDPEAEVHEGDVEGDGGGDEGAHVGVLNLWGGWSER